MHRIERLPVITAGRLDHRGRYRNREVLRAGRCLFRARQVRVHGKTPGSWAAGGAHRV